MISHFGTPVWPSTAKYDSGIIQLQDIGWGLSRIPRFAGHTELFYTVLLHSIVCSKLATPRAHPYALLHDAAEAFMGDVPSTWKPGRFKDLEQELLERIFAGPVGKGLHLEWPMPPDISEEVDHIDHIVLAAEAHVLGHAEAEKWWPLHRYRRDDMFYEAFKLTQAEEPKAVHYLLNPYRGIYRLKEESRMFHEATPVDRNDGKPEDNDKV